MPLYQRKGTNEFFAVCNQCGANSEWFDGTLEDAVFVFVEKYGWNISRDCNYAFCSVDHHDTYDIEHIAEILSIYDGRTG